MAVAGIEREAVRKRVDLVIAQMELDILAKQLGLVTRTRFINVLEVGLASTDEKEIDNGEVVRTKRRGAEVEFQIPIYDFGEARVQLAEETYMRAVNHLLQRAINVRAEARDGYQSYRGAWDVAKHYEKEILPLRKIVSDETLLSYNAMITDLFALLTAARARITANVQAIEALRDFWLASVDLQTAIIGGRSAEEASAAPRTATVRGGEAGGH
jgi:outer membrane protein TolC